MFKFNRVMHQLAYWYCLGVWHITRPIMAVCVLWFESATTNRHYWSYSLSKEISEVREILNKVGEAE